MSGKRNGIQQLMPVVDLGFWGVPPLDLEKNIKKQEA